VQVNLPIIVHIFGGDERGDPAPKLSLTVPGKGKDSNLRIEFEFQKESNRIETNPLDQEKRWIAGWLKTCQKPGKAVKVRKERVNPEELRVVLI